MNKFKADLEIIGINPFVFVPNRVLKGIFKQADRDKGPIPIKGTINGNAYKQTLVKYRGAWRLYVNNTMLKNSPKRIGETVVIGVEVDQVSREIKPHPKLLVAFKGNKEAKKIFDNLPPSRRNEIVRYISSLKTDESVIRNIKKVINHLTGKDRFVGRDKP